MKNTDRQRLIELLKGLEIDENIIPEVFNKSPEWFYEIGIAFSNTNVILVNKIIEKEPLNSFDRFIRI